MRWRSPSRTGGKQNRALRLFKQLEFIFRDTETLTSILSLRERRTMQSLGQGHAVRSRRDVDLESQARELLRSLGADKLGREVRVEWNPRMRTAAGRADHRGKLISLNPLLLELDNALTPELGPGKLDWLNQSSLTEAVDVDSKREHAALICDEIDRTLRHELAHLLAQWRVGRRRIAPHGTEWRAACRDLGIADEARCHNLPFATRGFPPRYVYRCPNCKEEFPRVRKIRRAIACLTCCRAHNGGDFDPRFRLKLIPS
jgi:SprT protein